MGSARLADTGRSVLRKGRGRIERARCSPTRGARSTPDRQPSDDLRNVQGEPGFVYNRPFRSRLNRQGKGESVEKSSETNYRAKGSRMS